MSSAFWPLIERKYFRIFALVQSVLLLVSLVAASFVAGFSTIAASTSGSPTKEAVSHTDEQRESCPRPNFPDDGELSRRSEACVKAAFSPASTYAYDAVLSSAKSLSVERSIRRLEHRHRVLDRRISPSIHVYDALGLLRETRVVAATNTPASPKLRDLAADVREAGLHPAARNNRTIAIGVDENGQLWAGSSNGFDAGQRAALERLGIKRVPGSGALHAEEELLRGVPNLKEVGTSVRMPCGPTEHNCAAQLGNAGVKVQK